jgi:hypothetical protein
MTEHSMAIQVSSIDEAINISNAIKSKKFVNKTFHNLAFKSLGVFDTISFLTNLIVVKTNITN